MRENYSKAISSEGSIIWRIREHSAIGSSQGEEFVIIKGDEESLRKLRENERKLVDAKEHISLASCINS
jgi:hypothetical protein